MVKKKAWGRRTRRTHDATFKAGVALAAPREDKTMAELCTQFELHATRINEWKNQLLERAADVFGGAAATPPVDLSPLHAKIVGADRKLSQVNNLPCCFFVQQRKRSDHHGHDWQDSAVA